MSPPEATVVDVLKLGDRLVGTVVGIDIGVVLA